MKKSILFLSIILLLPLLLFASEETRILRQPDINHDKIVFIYGGDIWIVSSEGGTAKRLTAHKGMEYSPKFSPCGNYIAFSGEYDGNTDVYVVSADGGKPKRLTYHPGADRVLGWTPDGTSIVFSSSRLSYNHFNRIFTISTKDGFPAVLPMPMAELGSYSPDGSRIAYTPLANAFNTWKRYRGGRTTPIWIFNFSDNSIIEIPHENASDTFPLWIEDNIYFLSDRNGAMNLFCYKTGSGDVKQLTHKNVLDIKNFSGNKNQMVYEYGGYLYIYYPAANTSKKVIIDVPSDLINVRPKFEKVDRQIIAANISPTGKRAIFEAHGEILTVPAEKGNVRNLTNSPGTADRYPAWSPDGKYIAYFSDANGEYALYITDQKGEKEPDKIAFKNPTFYYSPRWSPDSKKIAFTDKNYNIYYVDTEEKNPVIIDTDLYSDPLRFDRPVWSPDSKWIAYVRKINKLFRAVFLYSLDTGKSYRVTDGMSDADSPTFDKMGKYLYFLASTDAGPSKPWLDLSVIPHRTTMNLYLAVLDKDLPSPLAPESDEEKVTTEEEKEKEEKEEGEEKKDNEVKIDLDGIDQRIISLPVPARTYSDVFACGENYVFYLESVPDVSGRKLHRFDMDKRKAETFMEGLSGYTISSDGQKLLYQTTGNAWGIVSTSGMPKPGEGKLNTAAMEVKVDPRKEWEQMLYEAWRINRDFFYDPGMHGVDWDLMYKRYAEMLPHVAHRSDLNFLIGEMIGELVIGHAYVGGGDYPDVERVPGGLLGADYEIADGRYRFKKIYSGWNWNPGLEAPLTGPGINIQEGEYLISVNGNELDASMNIFSLFEKTAGKQVVLEVNSEPNTEGARKVTVIPVSNEYALRNREWVETNRKRVEELSDGKVGYVYLPNTSVAGYTYFNRYFFSQIDKKGLVIDERFNGGGSAADYIVDMLDRPLLNYWATRAGKDFTTPNGSVFGPKAMIINEYAGSGGDALPLYFRRRGIGPLIGKRTWGGLVGVYDYPTLIDGGYVTAPRVAIWSPDGKWEVENVGVPPDIEVELTPAEMIKGKDPQLEKAVEVVLEAIKKNPLYHPPRPPYPVKR